MQPKLCTKCKKNMAVVFITKIENGVTLNEGYCLKCARSLGIPQIEAAVKQMGFSDDDLDSLSDEMSSMFGQIEEDSDEPESRTATFPMLNQLFNNMGGEKENQPAKKQESANEDAPKEKGGKKHKFLDSYCMNLTGRAREGKLDKVIG
ncbi:MAG: ATP-dependent Clp protease ATP-binding subunit, partial [Oscillospiraceae bacterium]|nr:ATP-dependent Clp protease ATP-binding subunit [Oscillospiraceae bacterium]